MKQTPKQLGYTMPGEWYPHKGCWMAWPCHVATWSKIGLERAGLAYARTALAIAQYEPVTLIVRPEDKELAYTLCQDKVRYFTLAINDSWLRDTGPSFLIHKDKPLAGVDWIHNAWGNNYKDFSQDQRIASSILKHSGAQIFSPPLVMEGGAFHVDGQGTILTTKECLLHANRNPQLSQLEIERYLCDYLGAKKVIWLNRGLVGDETNGHVDEVACFIGPGKMLCLITQDKEDPNYFILQENLAILKAARDTQGRPFEVFTVEQPPATFLEGERLTLSYINFYHANKGIIMPSFGYHSYDKAAHDLFIRLLPGYGISQIHALDIFAGGGGIHCITQQEPQIQALA